MRSDLPSCEDSKNLYIKLSRMKIAVGYQKTVDDIEIGNSSAIGSPTNSRRSQVPFLSLIGFVLFPITDILGHPPRSPFPSHPRSAIRVSVSAVRLEHVPTFLFFMCTIPRAMGIPSYYLYRRCDFSFSRFPSPPRSQVPPPLPIPVSLSATDGYIWVPDIHRSPRDLSSVPYPFSAPYTYTHTHALTYNIRISLSLSLSLSTIVNGSSLSIRDVRKREQRH